MSTAPNLTGSKRPNTIDRLIQSAATSISRRRMLGGIVGAVALAGGSWMAPLVAGADNCNTCNGPCGSCFSQNGTCCSPNGSYCWTPGSCRCDGTCENIHWCGCFYASTQACDSGAMSFSCAGWCWC